MGRCAPTPPLRPRKGLVLKRRTGWVLRACVEKAPDGLGIAGLCREGAGRAGYCGPVLRTRRTGWIVPTRAEKFADLSPTDHRLTVGKGAPGPGVA